MLDKIRKWWNGTDTPINNPPGAKVIFIGWDNEKHWSSKAAHWIVSLVAIPERRSRLLAVLAILTFIVMLLKQFSHTNATQNPANPDRENGEVNTMVDKPVN